MSDIEEKFIQERLANEKSESKLFEQLQQLKEENEILRHTIHEWQHDCNKKREKLEKIKEICKEEKVIGPAGKGNVWVESKVPPEVRKEILDVIEGEREWEKPLN